MVERKIMRWKCSIGAKCVGFFLPEFPKIRSRAIRKIGGSYKAAPNIYRKKADQPVCLLYMSKAQPFLRSDYFCTHQWLIISEWSMLKIIRTVLGGLSSWNTVQHLLWVNSFQYHKLVRWLQPVSNVTSEGRWTEVNTKHYILLKEEHREFHAALAFSAIFFWMLEKMFFWLKATVDFEMV